MPSAGASTDSMRARRAAFTFGTLPVLTVRQDEGMRIGVLTGGGDCPGLNAVIRAVVRKGEGVYGHNIVGFRHGWRGVVEGQATELTISTTRGLLHRGGTILGTSRTNPYKTDDGVARVLDTLARDRIDALVAIGGEDTLGVGAKLGADGVNLVGVPKTIDNDLSATDFTFGFNTAVQVATDAIDRLHTTAESHDRVMVVEVMGRHAGWIATYAGMAGGADVILVPETPFDIREVCDRIRHRHQRGAGFSIVVVAEGAVPVEGTMATQDGETDEFGHVRLGGIGNLVQAEIERITGFETRVTILGHLLRGGTPSAYDRVLATRFGIEAIDAVDQGDFGTMVALRGNDIVRVPIGEGVDELKTVDPRLFDVASVFFG
jgi:ATP-dependent phosphofructokinase / diphosphate-dependent phosphofructokinase